MKKYIIFLPFLFCTLSVFAQSLIGENKQWYIGEVFITQPPVTFILKMEGDTLIDNKLYKKIYTTRDTANQEWTLLNELIREDSTKKVWIRNYSMDEPEEILLYDFNLVVGDSFAINLDSDFTCKIPVINVDSIVLSNGALRKRITFSFQYFGDTFEEIYWIEGIGSQFGLITHLYGYCGWVDYGRWLRCYFEDGQRQFGQVPDGECFYEFITNTDDLDTQSSFSIYPNPATDKLRVISSDNRLITECLLTDFQGRIIIDKLVNKSNLTLDLLNVMPGIYLIKIIDEGGRLTTKKVVVTD